MSTCSHRNQEGLLLPATPVRKIYLTDEEKAPAHKALLEGLGLKLAQLALIRQEDLAELARGQLWVRLRRGIRPQAIEVLGPLGAVGARIIQPQMVWVWVVHPCPCHLGYLPTNKALSMVYIFLGH